MRATPQLMRLLAWNVSGTNKLTLRPALDSCLRSEDPDLLVVLESKINDLASSSLVSWLSVVYMWYVVSHV